MELNQITIQAKLGSMVAYQGDVRFEHAGSGGVSKFIKKAVTGEGTQLMKISGTGEVFLAHLAQDVHILKLENEAIRNGANVRVLIDWDIKRAEGMGLADGRRRALQHVAGRHRLVAVMSDGLPGLLSTGPETPTFADPQAAITWSGNLQTTVKTDVNLKTFIGKGSGESIQIGFVGQGWVPVQPSEARSP